MNKTVLVLIGCVISASQLFGQTHHSAYSGQENHEIKSLSQEQIDGYLNGRGMGFAKAAELNHYPGPKHVLELADELNLSEEQIQKANRFYDEMLNSSTKLGQMYVQKEKELDQRFTNRTIDKAGLSMLLLELGELNAKIRFSHMNAHLQMKEVLSEKQIKKYDQLRGYHQQNKINHQMNNNHNNNN